MVSVFGIRHHGAGSAKTLLRALEQLQPDCILVEGPQDAEGILNYIADELLQPPVAILLYNTNNLRQAAYFPFATFSPEWQAIKFGLNRNLPVKLMDLPMAIHFALNEENQNDIQLRLTQPNANGDFKPLIRDPLGYLASLAGYSDSERWWEVTFEQEENNIAIFDHILELMGLLREELKGKETADTLLREAFMRRTIRQTIKSGFRNIAIVCGAWHAPVLKRYTEYKTGEDNAILKGMKKKSDKETWIT